MTFTHFVFPNSIFIFHPDYISHILLTPDGPDRTLWRHAMLIPAAEHNEARREHWEKSFDLIERGVFQAEDIYAAEGIQEGLRSGANLDLRPGRMEFSLAAFHRVVEAAVTETEAEER